MSEPTPYPQHRCGCSDGDLRAVHTAVVHDDGQTVLVRCGVCAWRRIPRAAWDTELRRRARIARQPKEPL